jgi:DNA end-binding protein Ku
MAPRPSWWGYLRLSLVTCPVAMPPATSEAEKVRFRRLNRAAGNPVHVRYVFFCWVDAMSCLLCH